MQRPLKHLNNSRFKDIYQQLATSKSNLEAIQNQLHQNPMDTDMQHKEEEERGKYLDILDLILKLMHQKVK